MQLDNDFVSAMNGDNDALNSWLENTNNENIRAQINLYATAQLEKRTLRDWFAGMALQGMLPNLDSDPSTFSHIEMQVYADRAYEIAKAMLAARNAMPIRECGA